MTCSNSSAWPLLRWKRYRNEILIQRAFSQSVNYHCTPWKRQPYHATNQIDSSCSHWEEQISGTQNVNVFNERGWSRRTSRTRLGQVLQQGLDLFDFHANRWIYSTFSKNTKHWCVQHDLSIAKQNDLNRCVGARQVVQPRKQSRCLMNCVLYTALYLSSAHLAVLPAVSTSAESVYCSTVICHSVGRSLFTCNCVSFALIIFVSRSWNIRLRLFVRHSRRRSARGMTLILCLGSCHGVYWLLHTNSGSHVCPLCYLRCDFYPHGMHSSLIFCMVTQLNGGSEMALLFLEMLHALISLAQSVDSL